MSSLAGLHILYSCIMFQKNPEGPFHEFDALCLLVSSARSTMLGVCCPPNLRSAGQLASAFAKGAPHSQRNSCLQKEIAFVEHKTTDLCICTRGSVFMEHKASVRTQI